MVGFLELEEEGEDEEKDVFPGSMLYFISLMNHHFRKVETYLHRMIDLSFPIPSILSTSNQTTPS